MTLRETKASLKVSRALRGLLNSGLYTHNLLRIVIPFRFFSHIDTVVKVVLFIYLLLK
jgi:hypothetical protein